MEVSDLVSRLALNVYGAFGYAALPFAGIFLRWRAGQGKEEIARIPERFGRASVSSDGRVCIWVHAASLGETRAVLPLIRRLADMQFQVLLTTATVTAANIASLELPKGATHQYAPMDLKPYIARFLKHWQPALAVFVESELWPAIMTELRHRHIPQVLVNARMSARSFGRWKRLGALSHALFENVSLCIAQTEEDAARFSELGVHSVINGGNLKFDSDLPDVDTAAFARMQTAIGDRPVWLAASTHDREEMIVAKAHLSLKHRFPGLLTIIVPRHPLRAPEIVSSLAALDVSVSRRSTGALPRAENDIYIADTVGELGLFYRLSACSLLGGSLVPHGGQNPIEPAKLGSAIIHGPNIANFAHIFHALAENGGCVCVRNSDELVRQVAGLLGDARRSSEMAKAALNVLNGFGGALERTHKALLPYLNPLIVAGHLADVQAQRVAGE